MSEIPSRLCCTVIAGVHSFLDAVFGLGDAGELSQLHVLVKTLDKRARVIDLLLANERRHKRLHKPFQSRHHPIKDLD